MEGSFALIAGGMILLFVILVVLMWYFSKKHEKKRAAEREAVFQQLTFHWQKVMNNPKSTEKAKSEAAREIAKVKLKLGDQRTHEEAALAMGNGGYNGGYYGGPPFGFGGYGGGWGGWGGSGVGIGIHADI